jgi:hypothetical protein
MYLLYVDESGGDDANAKDQYFVLGAIAAFERIPFHLSANVEEIQRQAFPSVTEPIEFRASAMWSGNGEPWTSMARPDRMNLMRRIYQLLAQNSKGVSLFGVALHKSDFPKSVPIQKTSEELAGHFDAYLTGLEIADPNHEKQRGLMIFDKSRHEKTVQGLMTEYRTTGARFGTIKHLAEVPLFSDSKITRMLQLADFIAYAIYRRYESQDAQFFDMLLPRFHQQGGVVHGLMHLDTNYRDCYCPACMSRRSSAAATA